MAAPNSIILDKGLFEICCIALTVSESKDLTMMEIYNEKITNNTKLVIVHAVNEKESNIKKDTANLSIDSRSYFTYTFILYLVKLGLLFLFYSSLVNLEKIEKRNYV